jgi:hypothetical protein
LFSGKHNDEVQLYAFDILALDGDDLRRLPLSMRKPHLARLLARRPDGIIKARSGLIFLQLRIALNRSAWSTHPQVFGRRLARAACK